MKYLILLLILAGCSTAPKAKPEYQDRFFIGCMNAYLHFKMYEPVEVVLPKAADWCVKKYDDIKEK